MRRMVVELLQACGQRYAGEVFIEAPEHMGTEEGMVRVMAYLPDSTARIVLLAAKTSGLSPGLTAKAMLYKLWTDKPEQPPVEVRGNALSDVLAALAAAGGATEIRPEQLAAFDCMSDALTSRRIGMVEASTGVGKSLAMLMAGIEWTEKNEARTCVAVPTLTLLRQCVAEYARIGSVREVPPLVVLFGKREFVSEAALRELMLNRPELAERFPAATEWLNLKGMGEASLPHYKEACWLAENLRRLAPEFPINEVILGDVTPSTDAGMKAYRAQFPDSTSDREILLCTHAMLAHDMRQRIRSIVKDEGYQAINSEILSVFKNLKALKGLDAKGEPKSLELERLREFQNDLSRYFADSEVATGLIPKYRSLIVDEAHMLESGFSSAFSDYLALKKLMRSMVTYQQHGGKISLGDINRASKLTDQISQKIRGSEFRTLASSEMAFARASLDDILGLLNQAKAVATKITAKTPVARAMAQVEIYRGAALLKLALDSGSAHAYMRFSPQRAYPQIYVGRSSLDQVFKLLWGSVDAAVAVSATLYLRRQDGPSANYMAGILQIPEVRRAEYPPIEARWLRDSVSEIFIPAGAEAANLRPPSLLDRLKPLEMASRTDAWLDAVAEKLKEIHASSAGGMLVLNTSYETVIGLHNRLSDLSASLVVAQEGLSLQRQSEQFLTVNLAGSKPIWLAVGSAWTGLDIGGHEPMERLLGRSKIPAEHDNVLTDLVIPRLPFGTNQSITHLKRRSMNPSMPWDLLDAAFRYLQGLGRLVRRKGLPKNRRIWVLDGRMDEPMAKQRLALFWSALHPKR